jgi:hypothetical protein
MPGDPKECREHAMHCLELASRSPPNTLSRTRLEELAQTWFRLANDFDHSNAFLRRRADPKFRKTG